MPIYIIRHGRIWGTGGAAPISCPNFLFLSSSRSLENMDFIHCPIFRAKIARIGGAAAPLSPPANTPMLIVIYGTEELLIYKTHERTSFVCFFFIGQEIAIF